MATTHAVPETFAEKLAALQAERREILVLYGSLSPESTQAGCSQVRGPASARYWVLSA